MIEYKLTEETQKDYAEWKRNALSKSELMCYSKFLIKSKGSREFSIVPLSSKKFAAFIVSPGSTQDAVPIGVFCNYDRTPLLDDHLESLFTGKCVLLDLVTDRAEIKKLGWTPINNRNGSMHVYNPIVKTSSVIYLMDFRKFYEKNGEFMNDLEEFPGKKIPLEEIVRCQYDRKYICPKLTKKYKRDSNDGNWYPIEAFSNHRGVDYIKPLEKVYGWNRLPNQPVPRDCEWTIGFEVEKNSFKGSCGSGHPIKHSPFFFGWETDSSCGIEGMSHVYDLYKDAKLFAENCMESSEWLRAPAKENCGGHITIKCNIEFPFCLEALRNYAGLLYSLYRHRLNISFCSVNKALQNRALGRFEGDPHYQAIREKGNNIIEFRLPSRVLGPKQMIWRYGLMQKVIKAVYKRYTWKQYIRSVKNHLAKVYTDKKRLDSVLAYADHFNDYFRNGVVPTPIAKYVKAYEHTDFDARLIQNRMNSLRQSI